MSGLTVGSCVKCIFFTLKENDHGNEMKWNKSACKISYELKYNLEYARERNIFSIYMIVMFVGIPGVKCRWYMKEFMS